MDRTSASGGRSLGRRISLTRANGAGASTTYGYDGASRLDQLIHNASGSANDVTFGYSYSPASQITGRTVSNALYKWSVGADFSDAYADNALNQITTKDGAAFQHDARGNTTNDGAQAYSYDADNRMTAAGADAIAYDPAGRLYQLIEGATTTRFLYAGPSIIAEYNAANAVQRRFVPHGLDEPLVRLGGSGTGARRWLLADERGSIIADADAAAAVTATGRYDPYGVPAAGNAGRFQYTGAPWVASAGLTHLRARTYAAATGRFMQADPIGTAGGMNLYAYVANDPVNFTDPWGLEEKCVWPDCLEGTDTKHNYDLLFLYRMHRLTQFPGPRALVFSGGSSQAPAHDYTIESKVCANASSVPAEDRAEAVNIATVPRPQLAPAREGGTYMVSDPRGALPTGGFVTTTFTNRGLTGTNETTRLHILHHGFVDRTLFERDGALYMRTHGYGANYFEWLADINQGQGPLMFAALDALLAEHLAQEYPGC